MGDLFLRVSAIALDPIALDTVLLEIPRAPSSAFRKFLVPLLSVCWQGLNPAKVRGSKTLAFGEGAF
jgi:hypothetical protein